MKFSTRQIFADSLMLYFIGFGVLGCLAMYGLLTLMSTNDVSFCTVVSVLVSLRRHNMQHHDTHGIIWCLRKLRCQALTYHSVLYALPNSFSRTWLDWRIYCYTKFNQWLKVCSCHKLYGSLHHWSVLCPQIQQDQGSFTKSCVWLGLTST